MKENIVKFPLNGLNDIRSGDSSASVLMGLEHQLQVGGVIHALLSQIQALNGKMDSLMTENRQRAARVSEPSKDGWLDSKNAAKYLGISSGSFDKYRYGSAVKIKGYPLDGKILYKRDDLDNFVKLYAIKLQGLA